MGKTLARETFGCKLGTNHVVLECEFDSSKRVLDGQDLGAEKEEREWQTE